MIWISFVTQGCFPPCLELMGVQSSSSISTLHLIKIIYSLRTLASWALRAVEKRGDEVGNLDTLVHAL